jgi:two-component system NarL family response regulator
MSGIKATRRIKADQPHTKVIMLTASQDREDLFASLRSGANGYLLKTLDPVRFFDLLDGVVNGDTPLAPEMVGQLMTNVTDIEDGRPGVSMLSGQQIDVLRLSAQGFTYREMAELLHLSQRTVQYHMDQIKSKLNVSSRSEAVAQAIQLGLVENQN